MCAYDPETPLPIVYPQNSRHVSTYIQSSIVCNSYKPEITQCPPTRKWIYKSCIGHTAKYQTAVKKKVELLPSVMFLGRATQKQNTEWKKICKKYILHDTICIKYENISQFNELPMHVCINRNRMKT